MKRSMILLAAVFALASTAATAGDVAGEKAAPTQAVQLSDAELDNITAGSLTFITAVFNPGKAVVPLDLTFSKRNTHCVNCAGAPAERPFVILVRGDPTAPRCMGPGCPF